MSSTEKATRCMPIFVRPGGLRLDRVGGCTRRVRGDRCRLASGAWRCWRSCRRGRRRCRLRTLDPAVTPEHVDPRTDARAQALLARTLGVPAQRTAAAPTRPRGAGLRLALVASAAAVTAGIVIGPTYLGGSEAIAWSAVPTMDADAAAAAAESGCAAQVASVQVPSARQPVDLTGLVPILSDVRGSLVLVYLTDGRSQLTCYIQDGIASFAGFLENTNAPQAGAVPADSVRGSGGSVTATDLGMLRAVTGRVGADVVSVVLDTVAKGLVTATVVDEHFAAWWPDSSLTDASEEEVSPGDELKGLIITLSDGSVRRVPVTELLARGERAPSRGGMTPHRSARDHGWFRHLQSQVARSPTATLASLGRIVGLPGEELWLRRSTPSRCTRALLPSQVYAAGDFDPQPVDPMVAIFAERGDRATDVVGKAVAAEQSPWRPSPAPACCRVEGRH